MSTMLHRAHPAADLSGLLKTLAGTDRFRTLLRAITLSEMTAELTRGGVTLFAPSDHAFERLPGWALRTLFRRPDRLRALIEQHLVSGCYFERDLIPFTRLPTRAGSELRFAFADDRDVLVNGVLVSTPDIIATDGVVHELDGVLLWD